MTISSYKLIFR